MDAITYKQIPGYIGYLASTDGKIYSSKNNKFLSQGLTRRGYREIKLSKNGIPKTQLVHRLIATAFYGPSTLSFDHINFDKEDNRVSNLRFISSIENHKLAIDNNRIRQGHEHNSATLSKEQVHYIRSSTKSNTELGRELGVTRHIVYLIKTNRSYKRT